MKNLHRSIRVATSSLTLQGIAAVAICSFLAHAAQAQFSSIINVPSTTFGDNSSIGSNTQLNVMNGGVIGANFRVGNADGPSTYVEMNVTGGQVGSGLSPYNGSVVNVSGGDIGADFKPYAESLINVTGGHIGNNFKPQDDSIVDISGGAFGNGFSPEGDAVITISGAEFRIDGELMPGMVAIGDTAVVQLNAILGTLSGTLADGTPFAFSGQVDSDFTDAPITLEVAAVAPVGPANIQIDSSLTLKGVRAGQTLTLVLGAMLPADFQAGYGSHVIINDGIVGANFEAMGATVDIHGGVVRDDANAFDDTVVNMDGGRLGNNFLASSGSTVNVSGGTTKSFIAMTGSQVRFSGGTIGDGLQAYESDLRLVGGEFRIDGVPVAGLDTPGNTVQVNVPQFSTLSGTLADGTPFAIHSQDSEFIGDGTLTLEAAALPAIGPSEIVVNSFTAPHEIRNGQTLTLAEGGFLRDDFSAAPGSTLVVDGGTIDNNLEAVGAHVTILDGSIDQGFDALDGTVVEMKGGFVNADFDAADGSVVHISGGTINNDLQALNGSRVAISGGSIGVLFYSYPTSHVTVTGGEINDNASTYSQHFNVSGGEFGEGFLAYPDSVVNVAAGEFGENMHAFGGNMNIAGGQIGDHFSASFGAEVNISGGTFGDRFIAASSSTINLFGTQFTLNGVDITETLATNVPLTVTDRSVFLTVLLADGSTLDIFLEPTGNLSNTDYVSPQATLTLTLIDVMPGDFNRDGIVDSADYVVWRKMDGTSVDVRGAGADGNFDGFVNGGDADVWRVNFGNAASGGGSLDYATHVPEPAGLVFAVMALLSAIVVRRR